jgi:molybdenum cofactor cytidylyltransferase
MQLGSVPVAHAVGAVLVHTLRCDGRVYKKGHVVTAADAAFFAAAGQREVICARLEDGERGEDAAAAAIARAIAGDHVTVDAAKTGRANLRAAAAGIVRVARAAIGSINAIDEAITVATLPLDTPVHAGELVATVKIIPFAVAAAALDAACNVAASVAIAPFRPMRAGLVMTRFADTAPSILDRAVEAQRTRFAHLGGELAREVRTAHDAGEVAAAIAAFAAEGLDPILALGASAIMDRRDVIPTAIERAGGTLHRFGMPVDPGNLLLLASLGSATVIGVPGCARSLARSGFDWVLERTCAGVPVTPAEIAQLGVGGLLAEAPRPSPRAE